MIEGEGWRIGDREPSRIARVIVRLQFARESANEKGDRDDPNAWVPIDLGKSVQLFELRSLQAGLFLKFTNCGLFECFVDFHKAAGQRPGVAKRLSGSANQQDVQIGVDSVENDEIDGDSGASMFILERHDSMVDRVGGYFQGFGFTCSKTRFLVSIHRQSSFFNLLTRPVWTHSVTKIFPS